MRVDPLQELREAEDVAEQEIQAEKASNQQEPPAVESIVEAESDDQGGCTLGIVLCVPGIGLTLRYKTCNRTCCRQNNKQENGKLHR